MSRGIRLNPSTGDLSGTPLVKPGVYKFVVTRRDAGVAAGTRAYYVEIARP